MEILGGGGRKPELQRASNYSSHKSSRGGSPTSLLRPPHLESCACAEDHTLREEGGDRISRYEEEKEEEKRDHRLPPGPRAALKVVGRGRVGGDHPQYRPPEVSWRPGIPLPKVSGRGPK